MRFMVMDANERLLQGEGHRLRGSATDHQGIGQPRPARGGERIQLRGCYAGFVQGRSSDGQPIPKMFAGGQFWNDSTVLGMKPGLRSDHIG